MEKVWGKRGLFYRTVRKIMNYIHFGIWLPLNKMGKKLSAVKIFWMHRTTCSMIYQHADVNMCHSAGKMKAAVQQDTVFTGSQNRSSCSLTLTRLRCFEWVVSPWGSCSGTAVPVLTCGKVVGKSSCLDWYCRLEKNQSGRQKRKTKKKKCDNVGKYMAYQLFWHSR